MPNYEYVNVCSSESASKDSFVSVTQVNLTCSSCQEVTQFEDRILSCRVMTPLWWRALLWLHGATKILWSSVPQRNCPVSTFGCHYWPFCWVFICITRMSDTISAPFSSWRCRVSEGKRREKLWVTPNVWGESLSCTRQDIHWFFSWLVHLSFACRVVSSLLLIKVCGWVGGPTSPLDPSHFKMGWKNKPFSLLTRCSFTLRHNQAKENQYFVWSTANIEGLVLCVGERNQKGWQPDSSFALSLGQSTTIHDGISSNFTDHKLCLV